jgi:hypothetical protein
VTRYQVATGNVKIVITADARDAARNVRMRAWLAR